MSTTTLKILEGLSRYQIRNKIGSGGMATVFLADDQVLRREVALKVMHEHLLNSPDTVKRFRSEAHAVASLSHENVIKVFDYGEVDARPFLVMEYVKGPTLISHCERHGPLPGLAAVAITRQILLGLGAAHVKGIYHRDIKPDNIMIDTDGTVKIMDFGIAYLVNRESLTLTGSFIGSPRFISPEQAKGQPLTGTTDIFSLGVLLYMCCTGRVPFDADVPAAVVHSIIHSFPEPVCGVNLKVLFWLSDFIDTCLVKDPGKRPDAAAALALIDRELLLHDLTVSKSLLRDAVSDPNRYREYEEKKLFEHYRTRSREALKNRQIAGAVRALEQARVFGTLPPEDEKAVRKVVRGRTMVKAAVAALSCTLCIVAAVLVYLRMQPASDPESRATYSVAADSRDSAPVVQPRDIPVPVGGGLEKSPGPDRKRAAKPLITAVPVETLPPAPSAPVIQKQEAWISVKTNPPWAKVFIDDIERGTTPARTVYSSGAGPHDIRIVKEGFAVHASTYAPAPGETLLVRVPLVPYSSADQ